MKGNSLSINPKVSLEKHRSNRYIINWLIRPTQTWIKDDSRKVWICAICSNYYKFISMNNSLITFSTHVEVNPPLRELLVNDQLNLGKHVRTQEMGTGKDIRWRRLSNSSKNGRYGHSASVWMRICRWKSRPTDHQANSGNQFPKPRLSWFGCKPSLIDRGPVEDSFASA